MKMAVIEGNGINNLFILGLCLFCFVLYFNSLNNNFVSDDKVLIVQNPFIKSFKFLPLIFQKDIHEHSGITAKRAGKMYRPLQLLTYSIDYKIWRFNPFGFHLSNTIFHLINSILTYYFLLALTCNNTLSKITSVLFLAHPVNTSVVAYISGRADLLVYLFMLLSVIFFLLFNRQKLKRYYAASLFCAALALLSRENALLLFILIMLVLIINKAKIQGYWHIIPFILLDLFYLALRFIVFKGYAIAMPVGLLPWHLRLINFLNIAREYLLLLIFPLNLRFFRSTLFITRFSDIRIFISLILVVLLAIAIIRFKKEKIALFAISWFIIGLIPVIITMDIYDNLKEAVMAESWLYTSSIGFFIVITVILNKFRKAGGILIIAILASYSYLTVVNNLYWNNDLVLYKNMFKYTSERNYMRANLINYYIKHRLYKYAASEIERFSVFYPDTAHTYFLWGNYYFAAGDFAKAADNYNKALGKEQNFFYAVHNLSLCYEKLGELNKAADLALECFKVNPYYMENLVWLADLYLKQRKFGEAQKYYSKALEIDPDNKWIKQQLNIRY